MIHAGVVPFLHPTYDDQGHLPIPDFLRPKTPEEFYTNMQRLIDNPTEYETVLKGLRKAILKPEYYDGSFINDNIMKAADPNYTRPDTAQFTKTKAATLEDFFA
jgi:hypothetical protein